MLPYALKLEVWPAGFRSGRKQMTIFSRNFKCPLDRRESSPSAMNKVSTDDWVHLDLGRSAEGKSCMTW